MVTQQSRDYEKLMPTFSNFCLANKSLRSSLTYGQCQSILLLEEIRQNKSSVRVLRKEFDNLQQQMNLQQQRNLIDYVHIC